MNCSDLIGIAAVLLQLAVAGYALRLNRLFGTAQVGWSLFAAFGLLAMTHLVLCVEPFGGGMTWSLTKVNVIYGLISGLLLGGMLQMEAKLKERLRFEAAEQRTRIELQERVRQQTGELIQANAELQQSAARLQAEIEERRQVQEQMEQTHKELLTVSRQAGMSEVATGVLHNVGNVLNSVNVSASLVADHLAQSKVISLSRVVELMREHAADLGEFITRDPRGRLLPDFLAQLARHLSEEQVLLLREIEFVKTKIEHIKEIVATQQSYGQVAGLTEKVRVTGVVEDVLRLQAAELAKHQVELKREFAPNLPEIVVDRHKLLQVLLNLLGNAKEACVASGQPAKLVTVRVVNGGQWLRVMISDNGVGIPAANLKKIFNHGFTTKPKGGHGFGLHSSALAAKQMGGSLAGHSEGTGRGATFTLELPLPAGAACASNPAGQPESGSGQAGTQRPTLQSAGGCGASSALPANGELVTAGAG